MRDLKEMSNGELEFALEKCLKAVDSKTLSLEFREIAMGRAEVIQKEINRRLHMDNIKLGIVIGLIIIGFMFTVASCCTVKGVMEDSAWILRTTADNIQTERK